MVRIVGLYNRVHAHRHFNGLEPARSGLVGGVMDSRPHHFHNLPLSPQLLHRYQVILLGDRGTYV